MNPYLCFLILVSMSATFLGCSAASDCSADSQCFQGEFCSDGACTVGVRVDSGTNNVGQNNVVNNTADGGDNGTPDLGEDATLTNNSTPDMGDDSTNLPDANNQICVVDRIISECAADEYEPNNTWIDGERLSGMMSGCTTTSTFVPLDMSLSATQCARDEEDWYYIDFFPCVNNDIELIWTLEFPEQCADTLFSFDSLSFDCGTEAACTSTEGGAEIRIQIPKTGQRQSQLSYVALKTLLSGFQSDYTLRIQVRQR